MTETTVDGFLDGRLAIEQPARGAHRAGLDAVLLAAALDGTASGRVLDLGAGVGVAGLAAAVRLEAVTVTLAEIDAATAALARGNVARNGLEARVSVVEADALAPAARRVAAGLPAQSADHVIVNPPFHPADRGRVSPSDDRRRAHSVEPQEIDAWIKAAAALVHPRGTLSVIFRADELARLIAAAVGRFGSLVVLPVHPRAGAPAHRVILRGRPQGRAPLRLMPGLVLHDDTGAWLPAADAVLRGAALDLDWWG
jgi:tRNA1(Val) A37 N6-methylase TrmN6